MLRVSDPIWVLLLLWLIPAPVWPGEPAGFQAEVSVRQPTRLSVDLAVDGLPAEERELAGTFDSRRVRYQLYVPPGYEATRSWPLVVFLAPGDDPLGWRWCRQACEQQGMLFCAAYGAGAGNNTALRSRMVLDVFDDVRRRYRIDPDQTYLAGFSSGAALACRLAFAFPEYVGGVVAVGGCADLPRLDYLRLLVRQRLSLAFVTGPEDFQRRQVEDFCVPYFTDLGIRTRLWKPAGLGHALPAPEVLSEVLLWLQEDQPRRHVWAKERPTLAAAPQEVPTDLAHAGRMLEAAETDLSHPDKVYRGVALLRGIMVRYAGTEPAKRAERLLQEVQDDKTQRQRLEAATAGEEKRTLTARARALERSGDLKGTVRAWSGLAARIGSPESALAASEMTRLQKRLNASPYLGLNLQGESLVVQDVAAHGPAEKAGLREGDRLLKVGETALASRTDLRELLSRLKPGDKLNVTIQRGDRALTVPLEVGRPPG